MEECRQQLIEALSAYNPSKPFQYIDEVLKDLGETIKIVKLRLLSSDLV